MVDALVVVTRAFDPEPLPRGFESNRNFSTTNLGISEVAMDGD